jgi:hypothetical protein
VEALCEPYGGYWLLLLLLLLPLVFFFLLSNFLGCCDFLGF